jgi:queuine tRNA-ribosyltransferase accessory subunit
MTAMREPNGFASQTARHARRGALTWRRPLPAYLATSSRGTIPHLTPDNILLHTKISSIHVGLEDFLTRHAADSPVLGIEIPLQKYLGYPDSSEIMLSARRTNPVPIHASWSDKIDIQTVDGRSSLTIDAFTRVIRQMKLRKNDTVISIPDFTEQPGIKRLAKMVERTQLWLSTLLKSEVLRTLWWY